MIDSNRSITQSSVPRRYYFEIDGLRAVAILAVLSFHIFPQMISGGYVGVDVFFVISGFLITNIILAEIENGKFSFIDFYARRALRILPLLFCTLLVTQLVGYVLLQRDEYVSLVNQVFSGAFFISNISLAREAGYFDVASDTKPLLHLWSLSIEEQFYILLPIILFFTPKNNIFGRMYIILFAMSLSFIWTIYYSSLNRELAFYALSTRLWELLCGVAISVYFFYYQPSAMWIRGRRLFLFVGILMILSAVVFFSPTSVSSPAWLLLPCLGAALIVAASSTDGATIRLLTNPLLMGIGKLSFSLYLWHWPVIVFFKIYYIGTPGIAVRIVALLITVVLSLISFFYIERPVRQMIHGRAIAAFLAVIMTLLGLSNLLYIKYSGDEITLDTLESSAKFYADYQNIPRGRWLNEFEKTFRHECNFFNVEQYYQGKYTRTPKPEIASGCYIPNPSSAGRLMIWGDSHAQMYFQGISNSLPVDWQILQVASSGCNASITNQELHSVDYCRHSNAFALETVARAVPRVLVIAQAQDHNLLEMKLISDRALKLGVEQVIFMGPAPRWTDDLPKIVARKLWPNVPERTRTGLNIRFLEKNSELRQKFFESKNIHYFDVISLLCDNEGCLTKIIDNDNKPKLTSWDYGHLTEIASNYVGSKLVAFIQGLLK